MSPKTVPVGKVVAESPDNVSTNIESSALPDFSMMNRYYLFINMVSKLSMQDLCVGNIIRIC
jgi:hypothetical protein